MSLRSILAQEGLLPKPSSKIEALDKFLRNKKTSSKKSHHDIKWDDSEDVPSKTRIKDHTEAAKIHREQADFHADKARSSSDSSDRRDHLSKKKMHENAAGYHNKAKTYWEKFEKGHISVSDAWKRSEDAYSHTESTQIDDD